MEKHYTANLIMNDELTTIDFQTASSPVEYLWERYGMSTYIEYIKENKEDDKETLEDATTEVMEEETQEENTQE